jgi:hypothetical protein
MRWRVLVIVAWCWLSACEDAHRSSLRVDKDAGQAPQGISLLGSVFEHPLGLPPGLVTVALEDVDVCQEMPRRCTRTKKGGAFELAGIAPEQEITLIYQKDGYQPIIQTFMSPRWTSELTVIELWSLETHRMELEQLNDLLRAAGRSEIEVDEALQRSDILFDAYSNSTWQLTDQVHVAIDPSSADGPFFKLQSGELALAPLANDAAGWGFFVNVEPREAGYELVFSHDHGRCQYSAGPSGGLEPPSGRANASWVPARAGYLTWTVFQHCKPSAADAGANSP